MKSKTLFLSAAVALCLCSSTKTAQAAQTEPVSLPLDSCFELARTHSAVLKNARLDVLAARAKKQEALASYFPKVAVQAFGFGALDPMLEIGMLDILGHSPTARNLNRLIEQVGAQYGINTSYRTLDHGWTASATAIQPLFAGGRIVNGNRLAQLGVQASVLQEKISERTMLEEVENSYWLVVSLEEKRKTLEQLQGLLDNVEKDVRSALAAGLATETDVMQVSLKQNELKSGKLQLENGIRLAKMNLFNTIGYAYNPYRNVDIEGLPRIDDVLFSDLPDTLLPPETYYTDENEIAAAQEEMRLLELQVDAEKLTKRMILGEALPQVGVGAMYGYSDMMNNDKFNGVLFVSAKVPLSDWGATARKLQGEEYHLQKALNNKEFYSSQILLQIRQLWLNLTSAWEQLQVAEESVETARKTTEQLTEHYRAGMASLSELLQAQTRLRQESEACIDRKIAYQTALQSYRHRIF
ncbi:MAG: TolC family protein [Bacteroidales bacterium]|nr:TolC family protein [Bacteroidales bacterium]